MAFFPCIYFETIQQLYFCLANLNNQKINERGRVEEAMKRLDKRTEYHKLLYMLYTVIKEKGCRLIIENPATPPNYLITGQNFISPTFIDKDRMMRGDAFRKPTAYWFINCFPTQGVTEQRDKKMKTVANAKASPVPGLCSEERSMISPDYARNFICDFVLGVEQVGTQLSMLK